MYSFWQGEEDEDSFVVDNSFVEYETEYVGDTMLAEDPIIYQVRIRCTVWSVPYVLFLKMYILFPSSI